MSDRGSGRPKPTADGSGPPFRGNAARSCRGAQLSYPLSVPEEILRRKETRGERRKRASEGCGEWEGVAGRARAHCMMRQTAARRAHRRERLHSDGLLAAAWTSMYQSTELSFSHRPSAFRSIPTRFSSSPFPTQSVDRPHNSLSSSACAILPNSSSLVSLRRVMSIGRFPSALSSNGETPASSSTRTVSV